MRDHARAHGGSGSGGADHDHRHGTPGKSTLVERDDGASADAKRQGGSGHGGGGGSKNSVEVSVGKTKNAELAKLIPVGTDKNHAKKVTVLQLKPSDLPALAPGDDLTTPCELELTTAADVGQGGYDPNVHVSIILGDHNDQNGPELAHKDLTLKRSSHHTTIVFGREAHLGNLTKKQIPKSPHVNVIVTAWHSGAGSGRIDNVIVGSNDQDFLNGGGTEQNQARLMSITERGNVNPSHDNGKDGAHTVTANKKDEVIASHELDSVDVGDQFYVEANVEADTNQRARFTTQLVLANSPHATHHAKFSDPGSISAANGENILPGGATTLKNVAVFKIGKKPSGKVFLNVVGTKGPAGATGSPTVKIKKTRFKVDRYDRR